MKVCSYCGRKNSDEQQSCGGCGTDLGAEPTPPQAVPEAGENAQPVPRERVELLSPRPSVLLSAGFFKDSEPLDLSVVDMGWSFEEGFSRPDWKRIGEGIRKSFPKEQWPQAWREVGIQWLAQLKEDLGGNYQQHESWNFLLLSAESEQDSEAILRMAENAVEAIQSRLDFPPRRELYGKRVILAFNEDDDYYSYISYFYPDGHHSTSAGIFIKYGYGHVALPIVRLEYVGRVLIHELTHNWMMDLHVPTWLHEGLSVRVEKDVHSKLTAWDLRRPEIILDAEKNQAHRSYWNEQNIQEFWAGTSFYRPGEGNRLSYNLGEIMVELLSENWGDFLDFVQNADPRDGGQDAALKCLDCCLGDTLAKFLGPGQWRPNRKTIAQLWEEWKQKTTKPGSST